MKDNTEFNYAKSCTAMNAISILEEHGTYTADRISACMEMKLALSEFVPTLLNRASNQVGSLLALVSFLELFLIEKEIYAEFREWEARKLDAMHSEAQEAENAENN